MTADDRSLFCTLGSVTLPLASQRSERLQMLPSLCASVCVQKKKQQVAQARVCMHVMLWQHLMRTHMFKTPAWRVRVLEQAVGNEKVL